MIYRLKHGRNQKIKNITNLREENQLTKRISVASGREARIQLLRIGKLFIFVHIGGFL